MPMQTIEYFFLTIAVYFIIFFCSKFKPFFLIPLSFAPWAISFFRQKFFCINYINFPFLKFLDNNVDYNFFNYAICCGTTSAIIESIFYKIYSTVYIGSNNLNLCPLPKKIFNNFSYNSKELEIFLDKICPHNYRINRILNLDMRFKKLNSFFDKLKI